MTPLHSSSRAEQQTRCDVHLARRAEVVLWIVGLIAAAAQAWVARFFRDGVDIVSYLDVADRYTRGRWHEALNGTWSPLYSLLLGVSIRVLNPSPYWEYPVVQLLNFGVFIGAMACFHFFLRQLMHYRQHCISQQPSVSPLEVPAWAWIVLGYVVFFWVSFTLIRVSLPTPDMCVAAITYLVAGVLLRMRIQAAHWKHFLALGTLLGLGFLAKSFYFPLAFVLFTTVIFLERPSRRALVTGTLVVLGFVLLAGPFVVALSLAKGRITFGDAGRFNYATEVMGVPLRHWQGKEPGSGTPIHPTREVFDLPATFEFAGPIRGTYPPWYDPSYWYDGLTLHFDVQRQLSVTARNVVRLFRAFNGVGAILVMAIAVLLYVGPDRESTRQAIRELWFLLIPSAAVILMFLVVHFEPRYVAPFVLLILLSLLSTHRMVASIESRRLVSGVVGCFLILCAALLTPILAEGALDLGGRLDTSRNVHWEIAHAFRSFGAVPGDKIASVTSAHSYIARWARLGRLMIVAEVAGSPRTPSQQYWEQPPAIKRQILATFGKIGARFVVSDEAPRGAGNEGWRPLDSTGYWIYALSPRPGDNGAGTAQPNLVDPVTHDGHRIEAHEGKG